MDVQTDGNMEMGKTCMPSDRRINICFSIAAYVAIETSKSIPPFTKKFISEWMILLTYEVRIEIEIEIEIEISLLTKSGPQEGIYK